MRQYVEGMLERIRAMSPPELEQVLQDPAKALDDLNRKRKR